MSRGYNARRKAKRQEARAAAKPAPGLRRKPLRRWEALVPALIIGAILAAVGILGFGAGNGVSKDQVDREVTELLDGIPQHDSELGSPEAPITLWVYADLECPTVKMFVENYLPSIIENWVRPGDVKLAYRSLETDTSDEEVFFEQEVAALAAARQDRMWNFVLTAVREQGEPRTSYVTEDFLEDVASQVPGLERARWRAARSDARLTKRVALGVYSGHQSNLQSTPSFSIRFTNQKHDQPVSSIRIWKGLEASFTDILTSLKKESTEDFPTLNTTGLALLGR